MKRPFTLTGIIIAVLLLTQGATAAPAIAPYPTASQCPTHDDRDDHGLWDFARGCYYDHTHGPDLDALNDKFGTQAFEWTGGRISSPWQTYGPTGIPENVAKHDGYFGFAYEDLPCTATNQIVNARGVVHQHPELDFLVERHSMWMEASGCDPQTGDWYAFAGGHMDRGDALVDGTPVPGGDIPFDGNLEAQHSSTSGTQVWYTCLHPLNVLHQCVARASLSIQDAWSATTTTGAMGPFSCYDSPNPNVRARCRSNATVLRNHLLMIDVGPIAVALGCAGQATCTWEGYADRYGTPVTGCSAISLDCIPMKFVNVPVGHSLTCDVVCANIFTDYDIYFCGLTVCAANAPGARPSGWREPHH